MTPVRPCPEFVLSHGGSTVRLRASLRAAVELAAYPNGFGGLVEQLAQASLTATRFVITASAPRPEAEAFLAAVRDTPIRGSLGQATAACLALVSEILPAPTKPAEAVENRTTPAPEKGKPWAEHFSDLFGFATGWLGWSPAETWNASPQEIEAAFTAHCDRLVKMSGGSDDTDTPRSSKPSKLSEEQRQANIEAGFDPEFDRAGLARLKSMMGA